MNGVAARKRDLEESIFKGTMSIKQLGWEKDVKEERKEEEGKKKEVEKFEKDDFNFFFFFFFFFFFLNNKTLKCLNMKKRTKNKS